MDGESFSFKKFVKKSSNVLQDMNIATLKSGKTVNKNRESVVCEVALHEQNLL